MKMAMMFVLAAAVFSFMIFTVNRAEATEADGSKKILIAYFSWSGNTKEIANRIHERAGGDLFEIKTVEVYPTEYRPCTDVAKKEQQENVRPALSKNIADMASYDVVFIGYPNWWGTIPMALFTFFESYDFSGKTIVPFCTHEGSALGRSVQDISKLCPRSTMLEGIAIRGCSVKSAGSDISGWLRRIGMEG